MPKNKKILMVAPYGYNDRMSNFIDYVLARLLAKNSWSVTAIARSENNKNIKECIFNINIYRHKNLIAGIYYLLKIIITKNPKIILICRFNNNRLGIIASMIAKLLRKKLIFTEYGLLHDQYIVEDREDPLPVKLKPLGIIFSLKQLFTKKAPFIYKLKNYFFHWPLTHAKKNIFISKHNIPIAQELGFKNAVWLPQILDESRWELRKTDVEKEEIDSQSQQALNKISNINNKPYALFIGQLKIRKGWDIMLETIPLVDKNIIPYFIFITSSANEEPDYFTEYIERLKIRDRVIFLGRIYNSEVLKTIYKKSKIIVVPSRYEGFGLVTTEAFEMKKPLIATNVPAINENVKHEYNGLLSENKNPEMLAKNITRVATDINLENKIIAGGTETLKKFKSQETRNQWLNFFENI